MSENIILKVRHLNDAAFHGGIRKLANHNGYPSFGTTFMVGKMCKQIMKETAEMNKLYHSTFKELIDEKLEVKEDRKEEYKKRLDELMDTDVELEGFKKLQASQVAKVGLTPAELVILEPIIDLSSAPLEAV